MSPSPIYFIPAGDYFGNAAEACFLVFSPLKNKSFLVLPDEAERLSRLLKKGEADEIIRQILPDSETIAKFAPHVEPEMTSLELLLNERCNFHCSYCYSAGNRSSAELTMEQIEPAIRFIRSCAQKHSQDKVSVTFIGGGEPVLSWDLIRETVALSQKLREDDNIATSWLLVTNGSLLSDEKLAYCKEHDIELQFSFDILERIQNLQRQDFAVVSTNLKKALKAGCRVYIRSTITEANVDLLPEMAEFCLREYPEAGLIGCEPVSDEAMAKNPDRTRRFYDRYFTAYREACRILEGSDITLSLSSSRALQQLRKRFCGPMFCLQAEGEILACAHFSSPASPDFEAFHYGRVKDGKVEFSMPDFHRIYPDSLPEECGSCWARWNCGGGCGNHRYMCSKEVFDIICEERKRILRFEILRSLGKQFSKTTGQDFVSAIAAQLSAKQGNNEG